MQTFKIRCSAIGQIMTNPRKKSETLSETTKIFLKKWVLEQKYNRRYEFSSKYTSKGTSQEYQGLNLLKDCSFISDFAEKNTKRFENDFMTGEPDILEPFRITDIKCSFEFFTFPFFDTCITNKAYMYQLQGYMSLTGIDHAQLAYCLVDTPEEVIEKEIYFKTVDLDLDIDEYESIEKEIRARHIFNDMQKKDRVKIFKIEKDQEIIENIYKRVIECRAYINELLKN